MQCVAIAGVGLIGGSFGLALRRGGFSGSILGVSSPRTIESACRRGAIDSGVTLEEAAERADLLLLAQPISVILETIDRLAPIARPECLITDAGSTKAEIVKRAASLPNFIGAHPMAGKETSGIESADASLFIGRPWILATGDGQSTLAPNAGAYLDLIRVCNAVPVLMSPQEHDRVVAWTSHLPQMVSTVLAATLCDQISKENLTTASGPGLKDVTRLASSSWQLWRDIVDTNVGNIQHALSVYIDRLTELRDNLQTPHTADEFTIAAETAKSLRRGPESN